MLAEIQTHPKIVEWDVDVHPEDPNEMYRSFKEFFEKLPENDDQLFLVGKLEEQVIGFLGIHRQSKRLHHVGVVGVAVHPNYWKRGYGTRLLKTGVEQAKKDGFVRLEADTLAENKAMRRIAETVGFKLEGVRKKRFKMNGEYWDEALLALLLK
jgi:RimJ/RimL family protein N-acetyltransferase